MLGLDGAAHEETAAHDETAADAAQLVISRLTCSLVGQRQSVQIVPGTRAYEAYRSERVVEAFRCSYGLNPAYQALFAQKPLVVSGVGTEGEVRVVELPDHRFYVATLYLPQLSSSAEAPHPLIRTYLEAAVAFRASRQREAG